MSIEISQEITRKKQNMLYCTERAAKFNEENSQSLNNELSIEQLLFASLILYILHTTCTPITKDFVFLTYTNKAGDSSFFNITSPLSSSSIGKWRSTNRFHFLFIPLKDHMDGDPSLTDPPAELSPSSASWNVPYEGDGDIGMFREAAFTIAALYSSS